MWGRQSCLRPPFRRLERASTVKEMQMKYAIVIEKAENNYSAYVADLHHREVLGCNQAAKCGRQSSFTSRVYGCRAIRYRNRLRFAHTSLRLTRTGDPLSHHDLTSAKQPR